MPHLSSDLALAEGCLCLLRSGAGEAGRPTRPLGDCKQKDEKMIDDMQKAKMRKEMSEFTKDELISAFIQMFEAWHDIMEKYGVPAMIKEYDQ
jgi:hypothetical protein